MTWGILFKITVLLHFWLSCARHGSWDVVWVCDVSSTSYGRLDKELRQFIADKQFNKTLPRLRNKYFT
jgi:hypothetical protein